VREPTVVPPAVTERHIVAIEAAPTTADSVRPAIIVVAITSAPITVIVSGRIPPTERIVVSLECAVTIAIRSIIAIEIPITAIGIETNSIRRISISEIGAAI
jgi:hypothetical protein